MTPKIRSKEDKVFSLVRNLKEYGYYKKDAKAASKLLSKAFPSVSENDAHEIIFRYAALYETLSLKIQDHKEEVLDYYNQNALKDWLVKQDYNFTNKDQLGLDEEKMALYFTGFLADWMIIR